MVTEAEIEQVTKLMKIDVHDHKEFVDKVHAMIDYFDILDKAGADEEEIISQELLISELREDQYIPYEDKLIERLKNYKGQYVRAPKMV
ncbi:MAG: hypothetical protein R3327_08135 [Nitrosopumilaceae archaeon]|nr:hypothetical protein [Nitrosopumilaceae archaeon]